MFQRLLAKLLPAIYADRLRDRICPNCGALRLADPTVRDEFCSDYCAEEHLLRTAW